MGQTDQEYIQEIYFNDKGRLVIVEGGFTYTFRLSEKQIHKLAVDSDHESANVVMRVFE